MTTITFEASKVKPYLQDKQLPAGWDDDDNAPFECEFFEFLQENEALDAYISFTTDSSGGVFKLPLSPFHFIYSAFTFEHGTVWEEMAEAWHRKLTELRNQNQTK